MEKGPLTPLDSFFCSHIVKPVTHHLCSPIPQKILGNADMDFLFCSNCKKGLRRVFPFYKLQADPTYNLGHRVEEAP